MESTKSGLCCQVNPEGACYRCGLRLCKECLDARRLRRSSLGKRDVWKHLLPEFKPCTEGTEVVFDGHFF